MARSAAMVAVLLVLAGCAGGGAEGGGPPTTVTAPSPVASASTVTLATATAPATLPVGPGSSAALRALVWTIDAQGTMRSTVAGSEAESVWRELVALVPTTGRWPIVTGPPEDAAGTGTDDGAAVDDEAAGPVDPPTALARAGRVDPGAWLAARAREGGLETTGLSLSKIPAGRQRGDDQFVTVRDSLTGDYLPEVGIALIPSPRSWEAPAWLGFGAVNESPAPEEHVALMHAWADRWGAEVFALAGDQVEVVATRPPTTRQQAAELAQEQFVYDADIVYQSEQGTREGLAADLMTSTHWLFSWE